MMSLINNKHMDLVLVLTENIRADLLTKLLAPKDFKEAINAPKILPKKRDQIISVGAWLYLQHKYTSARLRVVDVSKYVTPVRESAANHELCRVKY